MFEKFNTFLMGYLNIFRWNDVVDILIVTLVIYAIVRFIRETRAEQLIKGLIFLVVFTGISEWLKLNTINFVLSNAMQVGVLAIVIVFQPELRKALEKVGTTKVGNIFSVDPLTDQDLEIMISEIAQAAETLSKEKTGALIVLERNTGLGDVIDTGIKVNANVEAHLLCNLFYPKAPLHDGAVVIKNNRVIAAACLLPLSENNNLSYELGTRHRAAIGITENSDCVSVVVSEETGNISFAKSGKLARGLTKETLIKALEKSFKTESVAESKVAHFWKGRNK